MILFTKTPIVWVRLPASGLGNKISVWARASVFSELNNSRLYVSGWSQFKIGPWLRNERKKRIYWKCFKSVSAYDLLQLYIKMAFAQLTFNPHLVKGKFKSQLIIFNHYRMDFDDIKPHRDIIIHSFLQNLSFRIQQKLNSLTIPYISVHIRRGDFKNGVHLTPISFYFNLILKIRNISGWKVPVTIYTDAFEEEVESLFSIGSIHYASTKDDIEDLIEMSRSRLIISAARSTFSYWACFFGNSVVIKHPDEWFTTLRPSLNDSSNEWVINESSDFNFIQKQIIFNLFN